MIANESLDDLLNNDDILKDDTVLKNTAIAFKAGVNRYGSNVDAFRYIPSKEWKAYFSKREELPLSQFEETLCQYLSNGLSFKASFSHSIDLLSDEDDKEMILKIKGSKVNQMKFYTEFLLSPKIKNYLKLCFDEYSQSITIVNKRYLIAKLNNMIDDLYEQGKFSYALQGMGMLISMISAENNVNFFTHNNAITIEYIVPSETEETKTIELN